LVDNR